MTFKDTLIFRDNNVTEEQSDEFVLAWKLHEAVKECKLDLLN